MERGTVEAFVKLIDANSNLKILQNESIEKESCYEQVGKRIKFNPPDIGISESSSIIIDQLLEECARNKLNTFSVVQNVLIHQLQTVISSYVRGSSYSREQQKIICLISILLEKNVTLEQVSQLLLLSSELNSLPLNLIWHLAQQKVLSLQQIINRIKGTEHAKRLVEDALNLILRKCLDDEAEVILRDFVGTLVFLSYEFPNKELDITHIANQLLTDFLHKFLEVIEEEDGKQYKNKFINVFDLVPREKSLTQYSLKQFFSNQLILILTFKPEVPLTVAIQQQSKWKSTNANEILASVLFSIVKGLGYEECFNTMDKVVSTLELNWSYLLSFLSTLLLADSNSAVQLKVVVDSYLRKGCCSQESEYLILAFLFARHASLEGRHVFSSYAHWFGASFGSEASSPANSKQAFSVLIHFLASLVPYESVPVLRAHLHQSIFIPKGCQSSFIDYQRLVRVRLQELKEGTDDFSNSGNFGIAKSEQLHAKTLNEVESAVRHFQESGKIHHSVLEAVVFKRPYFLAEFLPILLSLRVLPAVPDTKMRLIEELFALGKIPAKMHADYIVGCREVNTKLSDDDVICLEPVPQGPLSSFQMALNEFVTLTIKEEDFSDSNSSQLMKILSKISESLESLNTLPDVELREATQLIVNDREFNPKLIIYRIMGNIFDATKKLLGHADPSTCSNSVGKLLAVLSAFPTLQKAFINTMLHAFRKQETENIDALGVLLHESVEVEEAFLPALLASSPETKFSSGNLFANSLPVKTEEGLYFSCCLLSACFGWPSKELPRTESGEGRARLLHLYFCLASRLLATNFKTATAAQVASLKLDQAAYLPIVRGAKILKCCQILAEQFEEIMQHVVFEQWINFELDTPWWQTPLDARIRHLSFWFNYFVKNSQEKESRFSFLFLKLVNSGTGKENSAELLVLLQSLLIAEDLPSISLLQEWKEWRKIVHSSARKEITSKTTYETQLVSFLSLCQCLPLPIFVGLNPSVATLSLFPNINADLLEMEGDMFLNVRDTTFLLETLLDACSRTSLHESQLWHCFAFRDSVLYHFQSILPLLKKHTEVVKKYHCLNSLTSVDVACPRSFINLRPKDAATLLTSIFVEKPQDVDVLSFISEQMLPEVLRCFATSLGQRLLLVGSFEGQTGNHSPDSTYQIADRVFPDSSDVMLKRMSSDVHLLVDRLGSHGVGISDPSRLMNEWREEAGVNTFSWRAFLLALTDILLSQTERVTERTKNKITWSFSLLLLCFQNLAEIFEKDPDESPLSVSVPSHRYLSHVSFKIHSKIASIPPTCLKAIPDSILRVCDKDLVSAIEGKIFQLV